MCLPKAWQATVGGFPQQRVAKPRQFTGDLWRNGTWEGAGVRLRPHVPVCACTCPGMHVCIVCTGVARVCVHWVLHQSMEMCC